MRIICPRPHVKHWSEVRSNSGPPPLFDAMAVPTVVVAVDCFVIEILPIILLWLVIAEGGGEGGGEGEKLRLGNG